MNSPSRRVNFDPSSTTSLREKTTSSAVLSLIGQLVRFVLKIGSMAILARLISPDEYGLMAIALAFSTIGASFAEAGLSSATIQKKDLTEPEASRLFIVNIQLGLVAFALIAACGPVAATIYSDQKLTQILPVLGFSIFMSSLGIQHSAILQRKLLFKRILARDTIATLIATSTGIVLAFNGFGVWSLVSIELTLSSLTTLLSLSLLRWRPKNPCSFSESKELIKFGANVLGTLIIGQISRGLDALILGYNLNIRTAGLYNRSQNLLTGPLGQILSPFMSVARPALSRVAHDRDRLSKIANELIGIIGVLSAYLMCVIIPLSDLIVIVGLGDQWIACIPIFLALTPFAIFEPTASLLSNLLIAGGKPEVLFKWRCLSSIIVLCGLLIGVQFGAIGVAISFSITGVLIRMPALIFITSLKLSLNGRKLYSISFSLGSATIFAAFVSHTLRAQLNLTVSNPIQATLATASFSIVLLTVLLLCTPTTREALFRTRKLALEIATTVLNKTKA